jgi:molybdopterin converting factor small subunit
MKVKVVAPFAIPGRAEDGSLYMPKGSKVRDIFRRAHAPAYISLLPVTVNGQQVSRSQNLREGDLVVIITPISGG